jgi:hypothetical protein
MTDRFPVTTLQYVILDEMPLRFVPPVDPYDVHHQEIDPEFYAALPQPFRDAAARAVTSEESDLKCADCRETIGWVLIEDDERPHQSGMRWLQVCIVATGEAVAMVCEDCSPEVYATIGEPFDGD